MSTTAPQTTQQPVDRARRYRFVFSVVGFTLASAAFLTLISAFGLISGLYTSLISSYTQAAMSLAGATTLAYITGSVVDYNGGIAGLFTANKPQTAPGTETTALKDKAKG